MLKNKLFAILMFGAIASSSAMAADGTIIMSGELVAGTCKIGGVALDGTVHSVLNFDLGKLPVSTFSTAGIAGPTVTNYFDGAVKLTNCTPSSAITMVINSGSGGISTLDLTNNGFKNTATTGAATNVISQIIDLSSNNVVNVAQSTGISKTTDATGTVTFNIGSRFYSTGVATAGTFSANGVFNFIYQ